MAEINFLLSDEFVAFSKDIVDLQNAKKIREAEFKLVYDQFMKDKLMLEAKAKERLGLFEEWKASQVKPKASSENV